GVHTYTKGCDWGGYDMRSDHYVAWMNQISKGDLATESHDPAAPPDTTAPTVTIVSPQGGATIDGDLDVHAEISDDGAIVEVRMYLDGRLTHTVSAAPYHFSVGMLADGAHTVRVVAKDDTGNEGEASISVTVGHETPPPPADTTAPTVIIRSPDPGQFVGPTFDVRVEATHDVAVEGIALLREGQIVDGASDRPFVFRLTGMPLGKLNLEVRARDATGNVGYAIVAVEVVDSLTPAPGEAGGCVLSERPRGARAGLGILAVLFSLSLFYRFYRFYRRHRSQRTVQN
ncbi:MAG: hypothetical protein KAI47_20115, partial [Deltaproteobacteria bacterium]|nr:hypothetical protein [Deltaproteobacteria bacterium]